MLVKHTFNEPLVRCLLATISASLGRPSNRKPVLYVNFMLTHRPCCNQLKLGPKHLGVSAADGPHLAACGRGKSWTAPPAP